MAIEIKQTKKYEQFKFISSNREVNNAHVKNLMKSIKKKNMLALNPILVNNQMEVIDGQHRLEASKRLKETVYYIVDDSIVRGDISALNSNKKNWGVMDYVNYYAIEKREGFNILVKYITEFPRIPVSTGLNILCDRAVDGSGGKHLAAMKEGTVKINNQDGAWRFANGIAEMYKSYGFAWERNFIVAMFRMSKIVGYDHEHLKRQIAKQPRSVVKCINAAQYMKMFEEIYNYQMQKRIYFR